VRHPATLSQTGGPHRRQFNGFKNKLETDFQRGKNK
jgi:hypothetical protein